MKRRVDGVALVVREDGLGIIHNLIRKNEGDDNPGNQPQARLLCEKTDCQDRDDGTLG